MFIFQDNLGMIPELESDTITGNLVILR